jgi:solute carrier family 25 oxoglutarate transporter 11
MGIFNVLNKEALKRNEGKPIPLYTKAALGLAAGGLGAFVGTPADLTLIRMQAGALLAMPPRA